MNIWEQFLSKLAEEWGEEVVSHWLRPIKLLRFDAANIYLEAQDSFQMGWAQEHLQKRLRKTPLHNNNGREVKIHLSLPASSPPEKAPAKSAKFEPEPLDPSLTFAHFIPTEENRLLLDLLQNIEKAPFNPIYLYGGALSGKTHLLTATAHALQRAGKKVACVRADRFTEQVIQAMRVGEMRLFRSAYRALDVLMVDEVQLFARKFATQEEFFHTFNELHTSGRQLLFSSRLPPVQLEEIEPRILSRFEWGITLEVCKISTEEVLQKKANLWNLHLQRDLIPYLLKSFPTSSLTALTTLALRAKGPLPIDPPLAEKLLKDLLAKESQNLWTEEKIVKKVADHFAVPTADLLSKSQTREIVLPRQVAIYLCRELLKLPYKKIGAIFGKDHSTIISSINQVKEKLLHKESDLMHWIRKEFD